MPGQALYKATHDDKIECALDSIRLDECRAAIQLQQHRQ